MMLEKKNRMMWPQKLKPKDQSHQHSWQRSLGQFFGAAVLSNSEAPECDRRDENNVTVAGSLVTVWLDCDSALRIQIGK